MVIHHFLRKNQRLIWESTFGFYDLLYTVFIIEVRSSYSFGPFMKCLVEPPPPTMFIYRHTHLSDQISRSVVSDSLRPHELQHARPRCPSPTPGVHSDSCPSSQWCHPAISSSVVPFSSCPQSLPASVFSSKSTLRMRWPKYWSFSFSISPSKEIPGLISFRMD